MPDANDLPYDPARPVVLVGYSVGAIAVVSKVLPERSVIVVEEPDVLRRREAYQAAKDMPLVRELVGWEFLRDHAADCFYLAHRDVNPIAVVPTGDYTVPFAARLAERYGVPGAGYGAAVILRNKHLQRQVTAAAGVANPRSVEVTGPDQVRSLMAELGGPVIIKPANRQATIGTAIVHDPADVAAEWERCLDQDEGIYLPDRSMPLQMLVEEYIEGEEFSVELVVRAGRTVFAAPTRKYITPGPVPAETGHIHPAGVDPELYRRLVAETERVIDAVGMDTGMVHCEWRVRTRDGLPYLVECNGRPGGGLLIEMIETAWEYDIVREFYLMMRGLPLGPPPAATPARYAGMVMTVAAAEGVIERVDGVAEAEAAPGVCTVIAEETGARAYPTGRSDHLLTFVTASGATEQEAYENARRANDLVRFTIRPD